MTPSKVSSSNPKPMYSQSQVRLRCNTKSNAAAFAKEIGILKDVPGTLPEMVNSILGYLLSSRPCRYVMEETDAETSSSIISEEVMKALEEKIMSQVMSQVKVMFAAKDDELAALRLQVLELTENVAAQKRDTVSNTNVCVEGDWQTAGPQRKTFQRLTFQGVQIAKQEEVEREHRKLNLVVRNVPEKENENMEEVVNAVSEILQDKLGLGTDGVAMFKKAQRMGKPSYSDVARDGKTGDVHRPIIIECSSMSDKVRILKAKKCLRGTALGIDEHLTPMQRDNIREQLPAMRKAREEGKWASFHGDKLVIKPLRSTARPPPGAPAPKGKVRA